MYGSLADNMGLVNKKKPGALGTPGRSSAPASRGQISRSGMRVVCSADARDVEEDQWRDPSSIKTDSKISSFGVPSSSALMFEATAMLTADPRIPSVCV